MVAIVAVLEVNLEEFFIFVPEEEDGNATVCITLSGATLARPVTVLTLSLDFTATGNGHAIRCTVIDFPLLLIFPSC